MRNEEIKVLDFSATAPNASGDTYSTFQPTLESLEAIPIMPTNLLQTLASTSPHAALSVFSSSQSQGVTSPEKPSNYEKEESFRIVQNLLKKRKLEKSQVKPSEATTAPPKHEKYRIRTFTTPAPVSSNEYLTNSDQKCIRSASSFKPRKHCKTVMDTKAELNVVEKLLSKATLENRTRASKAYQSQPSRKMPLKAASAAKIEATKAPNVWERMKVRDNLRKETILAKTLKSRFEAMSHVTGRPYISKNSRMLAAQSACKVLYTKR